MGTGQMLLTVLAVFLLTTVILTNTRGYVYNTETMVRTKTNLISVSIATSYVERASKLAFDKFTIPPNDTSLGNNVADSLNDLTSWNALGPEAGNTGKKDTLFDDFDDYNNFYDSINPFSKDTFYVRSSVCYVDSTKPYTTTLSRNSWAKKITVKVWPKGYKDATRFDTITMTKVVGYWRWR